MPMIRTMPPPSTPASRALRVPPGRRAPPVALDPGSLTASSPGATHRALTTRSLFIENSGELLASLRALHGLTS